MSVSFILCTAIMNSQRTSQSFAGLLKRNTTTVYTNLMRPDISCRPVRYL